MYHGLPFKKSSLFFHKFFFILNKLFQICFSRCAGRAKLFAEASKLFTHAVLLDRRRQENGVLIVNHSGAKIMEVGGC